MGTGRSVLLLHPSDDWYGADVMALRAASALRDSGFRVRVILPLRSASSAPEPLSVRLAAEGIEVRWLPLPVLRRRLMTPTGLLRLVWSALAFVIAAHRLRASVVLVNTSALSLCVPGLWLWRRRTVVYLHETLEGREAVVLGRLLRLAGRLVTVSHSARDRLPRTVRGRAAVVENAVPNPASPASVPDSEPLRFLFVGRWSPRKGVAELVRAWQDGVQGELVVLGGFPPEGAAADFDPCAVADPHVRLVGEVPDVSAWISASHVVVIPSLLPEGMPMIALEALAHGRPLVATMAGGLGEVIDESVGWVLPREPGRWPSVLNQVTLDGVRAREGACRRRHHERFSVDAYRVGLSAVVEEAAS